ncbi:MAG: hypothetical protein NTV93_01585 [Verrucomicrobia bacterium]|nr:hypothetical protein [Verrucomicrobiota bacterium]
MKPASLITAALLFQHSAMACVGCREPGAFGPDEPQTVMAGMAFSWSVLTMLVIVGAALAGLGFYITKTCRRVDRENGTR